jgi:transposase
VSELITQMQAALRARHYSRRTEQAYCLWVRRFIRFHHLRHPREMGERPDEDALTQNGRTTIDTLRKLESILTTKPSGELKYPLTAGRLGVQLQKAARVIKSGLGLQMVGIDETSLRRGQHYITVVHDLDAKRLLFATEGRDHQTVLEFAADLKVHGGDPAEVRHVCMDMSAAYAKGAAQALPAAIIIRSRRTYALC